MENHGMTAAASAMDIADTIAVSSNTQDLPLQKAPNLANQKPHVLPILNVFGEEASLFVTIAL